MHDCFDGCKGIEVGVCGDFLVCGDIVAAPIEKPCQGPIDQFCKDRWVDNGLPEDGGREDRFTAEKKKEKCWPGKKNLYHQ